MAIIATNESKSFEPIEAGTYLARCYSMIDLGTHTEDYLGESKELHKVRLAWELPTEMKVFKEEKGEQPLSIAKEFTLSMHEKSNLRKTLEAWRGKGFTEEEAKNFNITKLLGVPCQVSIIHKTSKQGKLYAVVSGVSTIMKGIIIPEQINPSFEFTLTPFEQDKLDSLPDWLKEKIRSSKEYIKMVAPEHTEIQEEIQEERQEEDKTVEGGDDLPF